MTINRGGGAIECCMCGDYGLSSELFKCKICQFRSQHRYCSNLYPKAESYKICNWCLSPKDVSGEKTQNSSNSSSSCKNTTSDHNISQDGPKLKKKLIIRNENNDFIGRTSPKGKIKGSNCNLKVQLINKNPIKLQKSPLLAARKRVIIDDVNTEEKVRRTKSEEMSNRGITRKVFKNRVRRYKLLDEVSS
ncbi:hypothetical protein H5410_024014 [Solanum commersonii]|uniref:PHD-type zinc finger plants domain-containing protein n=1 Tax=Solanum commersonii TaxID=4109 RepID=A0A9J5ZKR6_SOLCO|nr:hypothetical protein H5410_024014 [Solanum commersonii]